MIRRARVTSAGIADRESRPLRPVTVMACCLRSAWTGSWTGSPGIPALRVLPVRFSVSSVLPVRSVHGAVVMVRRRSTVRFRNGAQAHRRFSNKSTRRRGPSPGDAPQLPLRREGPAGVTEGSHRRSFHGGPDHRRTSREGVPRRSPAREVPFGIRLMERSGDARSHPLQPCVTVALLVSVRRDVLRLIRSWALPGASRTWLICR